MPFSAKATANYSKTRASSVSNPWEKQQPYIMQGFKRATENLNRDGYGGPNWAGINENQYAGSAGLTNYMSQNAPIMQNMYNNAGLQMSQGMGSSFDYNNRVQNGGSPSFNPDVFNSYVNDPNVQAAMASGIAADQRDVNRDLNWNQQTGQDINAAMTGNSGSGKYMQNKALNANFAADRNADISAQYNMNNINTGMQLAQQDIQRQDAAARNNMQYGQQGYRMMDQGFGYGQMPYEQQRSQGDYMYGLEQEGIDRDRASYFNDPWSDLQNYWSLVSSNDWGGSTKSKSNTVGASVSAGWM